MFSLHQPWNYSLTHYSVSRARSSKKVTPEVFRTLLDNAYALGQFEFLSHTVRDCQQSWVQEWLRSAKNLDLSSRMRAWLNPMVTTNELQKALSDGLITQQMYDEVFKTQTQPAQLKSFVNASLIKRVNWSTEFEVSGFWMTTDTPDEHLQTLIELTSTSRGSRSNTVNCFAFSHHNLLHILVNPNFTRTDLVKDRLSMSKIFVSRTALKRMLENLASKIDHDFTQLSTQVQQLFVDNTDVGNIIGAFQKLNFSSEQLTFWQNVLIQKPNEIPSVVLQDLLLTYGDDIVQYMTSVALTLKYIPAHYWIGWLTRTFGNNPVAWLLFDKLAASNFDDTIGMLADSVNVALQQ